MEQGPSCWCCVQFVCFSEARAGQHHNIGSSLLWTALSEVSFSLGVFWKKLCKDLVFYSGGIPADCSWQFLVQKFVQSCAAVASVHWFCTRSIFLLHCGPAFPQEEVILLFAGFQFWGLSVLFLCQVMQNPCMAEHTFYQRAALFWHSPATPFVFRKGHKCVL